MKFKYHCMLWLVSLTLVVAVMLLARETVKRNTEGFDTHTACVNQGYPYDFCMRTPPQMLQGEQYCNCANGQIGTRTQPGMCSCFPYENMFPYYPSPTFSDWLR